MRTHRSLSGVGLALVGLGAACAVAAAPGPLPALTIDPARVSVSGLSSGGFMAVQLHVAHSATFRAGAGVVAGGPYFCAENNLFSATGRCMAHSGPIPVAQLAALTRTWAAAGLIDPVAGLASSKVYLFSGAKDEKVRPPVMHALKDYYAHFVPAAQVAERFNVEAGHAMVTDDSGNPCPTSATPFINDCDVDVAGALLQHLHGPLAPRNAAALSGQFTEIDQTPYVRGHGMAESGWVYVPQVCAAGTPCGLHVVLHGCQQNTALIGERYVRNTGYPRWADTNRLVLLYPQTGAGAVNACWDWWGYDNAQYAQKAGPQIAAIKAMVDRVSARPVCFTASNLDHVSAGRADFWWGLVRARGSAQTLGWWGWGRSTLRETAPGTFVPVALSSCAP